MISGLAPCELGEGDWHDCNRSCLEILAMVHFISVVNRKASRYSIQLAFEQFISFSTS